MVAPDAAPGARLKVRLLAGISASLAKFDTTIKLPAWTVRLPMVARMGAEFVAETVLVVTVVFDAVFVTETSVVAILFASNGSGVLLDTSD